MKYFVSSFRNGTSPGSDFPYLPRMYPFVLAALLVVMPEMVRDELPSVSRQVYASDPGDNLSPQEPPLMAYVGTFSSPLKDTLPTQVDLPPGNGRGIHIFEVDRSTGALIPKGLVEMGNSPSRLAVNSTRTRLYSANETDRIGPENFGSVSAFEIETTTGLLKLLGTAEVGSQGPTYVALHPSENVLFTANYFGGSVSVLPLLPDGRVGKKCQVLLDQGSLGPTRARNAPPGSFAISGHDRTHAHIVQPDPSGQHVLHIDLGLDKIFVSKFDVDSRQLQPHSEVSLPDGDGPRHLHFHPNGRWLYSIQEEGSTVVLFDYDSDAGKLTARQTVSTLPPAFAGSNFCSEILVSADGRNVYAGNRLFDSVAVFSVGETGELTCIEQQWTRGNYPRSFTLDPSGSFLYCCNQRSDNVTIFRVQRETGRLEFTGQFVPVGNPSHLVFVNFDESFFPIK